MRHMSGFRVFGFFAIIIAAFFMPACKSKFTLGNGSGSSNNTTSSGQGQNAEPVSNAKVATVSVTGACLQDSNEWSHASNCGCPPNYHYNPVSGQCDGFEPIPAGATKAEPAANHFQSPGVCADDLNEWNNPSICECPAHSYYNPVTAQCDTAKTTTP